MAKPFYASKTFWFNVLALIVMVANAFGFAGFEPDASVTEIGTFIIIAINLVLRLVTKQPLKLG